MSDGERLSDGELERIAELFDTFEPGPALYWGRRILRELRDAREAIDLMQTAHESQLTHMAAEGAKQEREIARLKAEIDECRGTKNEVGQVK